MFFEESQHVRPQILRQRDAPPFLEIERMTDSVDQVQLVRHAVLLEQARELDRLQIVDGGSARP